MPPTATATTNETFHSVEAILQELERRRANSLLDFPVRIKSIENGKLRTDVAEGTSDLRKKASQALEQSKTGSVELLFPEG
jgi:hypothetical protein